MSLIKMLEELYVEMVQQEDKNAALRLKIEAVLEQYYADEQPAKSGYLDNCPVGHIIKDVLNSKHLDISVQDAKLLQKYVVIYCTFVKRNAKGNIQVSFKHVGSTEPKEWVNSLFTGIDPLLFQRNSYYIIADDAIGKKHNWTFANQLSEEDAVRIATYLKKPVGMVRHHAIEA